MIYIYIIWIFGNPDARCKWYIYISFFADLRKPIAGLRSPCKYIFWNRLFSAIIFYHGFLKLPIRSELLARPLKRLPETSFRPSRKWYIYIISRKWYIYIYHLHFASGFFWGGFWHIHSPKVTVEASDVPEKYGTCPPLLTKQSVKFWNNSEGGPKINVLWRHTPDLAEIAWRFGQ